MRSSTSRRMVTNQAACRASSALPLPEATRASTSRARPSAAWYEASFRPSSLPMARLQTAPRLRGATPCHHSSRVRRSRTAVSHLGRMSSSQRCCSPSAAWSRCSERTLLSALRRSSASLDRTIIFWYSFRWRRSSAGSFGGSHEGRVRERTASFSLEMGRGSIMMFVLRRGGSSGRADLTRGLASGSDILRGLGMEPVLERWPLCSSSEACSSSFSVRSLASALSSARAAVQLLARVARGLGPMLKAGDLRPETIISDFHVGDRSEPLATATAGVPLPTLRTRSLGLSGEVDFADFREEA